MSVSGISSTSFFGSSTQSVLSNTQKFRKEFQQLGQDLQSGNISAAQSDFATLQQLGPQSSSASSASYRRISSRETSRLRSRTTPRFSRISRVMLPKAAAITIITAHPAATATPSASC
jgi:hypothetical protein